jgi:hypothetical protein
MLLRSWCGAELLFQRGTPPDAEYTFKHALVQDAAYSTLLRSRRQPLHARIASTLENRFPETAQMQPELLARYCAEAGVIQKAIGYWLHAGRHATARSAMNEAVAQLRNRLRLLSGIPEGATRQKYELDLQVALGYALIATKGYSAPEAGEAYARARLLCDQLDNPSQLGPILYGQYAFRGLRGELAQAEHHAEETRQLGEVSNDGRWRCFGAFVSGNVTSWLGKFLDSRACLADAGLAGSADLAHRLRQPLDGDQRTRLRRGRLQCAGRRRYRTSSDRHARGNERQLRSSTTRQHRLPGEGSPLRR